MKHENRFESIPSGSEDNVPALLRKKHFPVFFFLKLHTLIGIIWGVLYPLQFDSL